MVANNIDGADEVSGSPQRPGAQHERHARAGVRLLISLAVGVVVGVTVSVPTTWRDGILLGWMAAGFVFVTWVWAAIWSMDAATTAQHAAGEDAGRAATDAAVLLAAVASLVAVGLFLAGGSTSRTTSDIQAALSVVSIALAWAAVHTVFTVRYARLYYTSGGGIDFNEADPPQYTDFAYLAFTIGMTFQVSDTDLTRKEIRATALRQALLSYLFGAVIIAATINLVAGLAK